MIKPKFIKIHPDAIIPTVRDKIYYDLHVIAIDNEETIDGEKIYYFRTGLKVIQPKSHVMYLQQRYFNYELEYSIHGFTFQTKIKTIYPEDQSEIIIPMRASPEVNEITIQKIYSHPIATLISRKKDEIVYVKFVSFPGYEGETVYDFLQVNKNEDELNYLINILVPIIYAESRKDGSYTFDSLNNNFTKSEARTVRKVIGSEIHNGILKHILLEGKTLKKKAKTFASHYSYGKGPSIEEFFKTKESDPDIFDPDADQ